MHIRSNSRQYIVLGWQINPLSDERKQKRVQLMQTTNVNSQNKKKNEIEK